MTDTGLEVGVHVLYISYIWIIEAHFSFPKPCEYIWTFLHTRNINSTFFCRSCFVWESNHIKIKSLQSSCCSNDLDLTVPSQRQESMADRLIYLVRNGTWPELLFLLAEPMLSHVLTFCMMNSSTHHDMVLRLVANNWLLSDRVSQQWWQKKIQQNLIGWSEDHYSQQMKAHAFHCLVCCY